jgi:predicted nucleotidyltransferase
MVRTKNEVIAIAKEYIKNVEEVFYVEEAWLYGSYAKDTANEWSDIDIAILSKDFDHIPKVIGMKFLGKIAQKVDSAIEAVIIRPKEKSPLIIGTLAEEIIRTGILIR